MRKTALANEGAKMAKHPRSKLELQVELGEQAEALRSSAVAYDSGKLWEAKRLATTAYILLHDGGRNSKSLLAQLGVKGEMLSTADHGSDAPLPLASLTIGMAAANPGMTFSPVLTGYTTSRTLPFNKWYEEPVFVSGTLRLTRKNLIFTFRSQAGGAHVDGSITNDAFQWLHKKSPIHVKTGPTSPARDSEGNEVECPPELEQIFAEYDGPVPNGHAASMRQIAWEIDHKLQSLGY